MIKSKKEDSMVFKSQYEKLSVEGKAYVREGLIRENRISVTTFYYKLRKGNFQPLEIQVLNRLLEELTHDAEH